MQKERLEQYLRSGSELAGNAAGAAVGLIIGGPVGAVVGATSTPALVSTFRSIALELQSRILSPREIVRTAAALDYASVQVERNLAQGLRLRADGFWTGRVNERSAAAEVLEGVVLVAQREHEEAKIEFIGTLLGNLPFREDISRARANALLRRAESLSYRQLIILSLIADPAAYGLREHWFQGDESVSDEVWSALVEMFELYSAGLILNGGYAAIDASALFPGKVTLNGDGVTLFELMGLSSIAPTAMESVAGLLRKPQNQDR